MIIIIFKMHLYGLPCSLVCIRGQVQKRRVTTVSTLTLVLVCLLTFYVFATIIFVWQKMLVPSVFLSYCYECDGWSHIFLSFSAFVLVGESLLPTSFANKTGKIEQIYDFFPCFLKI